MRSAIAMGRWEIDVQLDVGAVMGGRADVARPTPAIFNTGQVNHDTVSTESLYQRFSNTQFVNPVADGLDILLDGKVFNLADGVLINPES